MDKKLAIELAVSMMELTEVLNDLEKLPIKEREIAIKVFKNDIDHLTEKMKILINKEEK